MNRFRYLLMATVLAMGSIVFAQADPDPDGVGIYFDQAGMVNCIDQVGYEPFYAWLVLTNLSNPDGVGGFECRITFNPDTVYWMGYTYNGGGTNYAVFPDFLVGLYQPL